LSEHASRMVLFCAVCFFFSSRRRHTRLVSDWSSDVCSSDLLAAFDGFDGLYHVAGGSGRRWGDGPLHEITDEGWRKTLELNLNRSEERRVGKEGRCGWGRSHEKKKTRTERG